jgi:hypothetical protein
MKKRIIKKLFNNAMRKDVEFQKLAGLEKPQHEKQGKFIKRKASH